MKTPAQIRDMEFQKSTVGGYKQSDVEMFLEEVATQIEVLMKQKADSDRKLQELSQRSPDAALSTAGIQNVLISAQKVADQVAENARQESERIVAESKLKVAEADIKAKDIVAEAEKKAVLLGETAEKEAARIIAEAVDKSEKIFAAAKESVELQQKLYDRLKIEVADFKRKAVEQCNSVVELLNQLPSDVAFDIDRAKAVLSIDFSNSAELLEKAVNKRLEEEEKIKSSEKAKVEDEKAAAERAAAERAAAERAAAERAAAERAAAEKNAAEKAAAEKASAERAKAEKAHNDGTVAVAAKPVVEKPQAEENIPFASVMKKSSEETVHSKGHISFGEDESDDDDLGSRSFFKRHKK